MQEITLQAETGRETGSGASRRLRASGHVPGVLYGKDSEPVSLSVPAVELRTILMAAGGNAVIRLQMAGVEHLTLVKQLQRHPVRQSVDHIDFQLVDASDTVHVEVPVRLIGEAENVSRGGGSVDQAIFHVHVHCSPIAIPAFLEADITDMEIGTALTAEALVIPAGVVLDLELSHTIASAHLTRAALSGVVGGGEEGEDDAAEATAEGDSAE